LKTINRIAGAVLGLVVATLILGVILIFLSHFPFSDWLTAELAKSQIALWLMAIAKVLTPLLPKIIIIKIILKILTAYYLRLTAVMCITLCAFFVIIKI